MANKRNKKKLSSKQTERISLIITTVYFILTLVIGVTLTSKLTEDDALLYWAIMCATGTFVLFNGFYYLIFRVDYRKLIEIEKEMKIETAQYLSYTDFKQVYFLVRDDRRSDINLLKNILQKEEYKFYAKLIENNNIYLVVKDKHNEEVYSEKIENYIYFYHNFKFKE